MNIKGIVPTSYAYKYKYGDVKPSKINHTNNYILQNVLAKGISVERGAPLNSLREVLIRFLVLNRMKIVIKV